MFHIHVVEKATENWSIMTALLETGSDLSIDIAGGCVSERMTHAQVAIWIKRIQQEVLYSVLAVAVIIWGGKYLPGSHWGWSN